MIKKYEIITVEGRKRVKALRSFSVQGRYVNVGDVGGIVYDENTLSQEGNAWIFSGNLNYPSIRVGGDSIVDTNGYEGAVTEPRPFVNITGTSALIGAHEFVTGKISTAKVLAVGDVESFSNVILRTKNMVYSGGLRGVIATSSGEGYQIRLLRYNEQKKLTSVSNWGVSLDNAGAYYVRIEVQKNPSTAIVPADITAAKVPIPSIAIESTINIKDSRIVFDYTGAMTIATKVNAGNATSGYRESNISESNVVISKTGNGAFVANIFADVVKCNVEWRLLSGASILIGGFTNVERLVLDGSVTFASSTAVKAHINAKDCRIFSLYSTMFPVNTVNDAIAAQMPFTFIRCNVEHGLFYHNPVNRNVYKDIDFEKALTDLSEPLANANLILVSGEKQGMYRVVSKSTRAMGPLVEDIHSVKNLNLTAVGANTRSVEIYKDAYLEGAFTLEGTQVYGGSFGHDRSTDLKPHMVAVRGAFNTQEVGQIITGTVEDENTMIIATPVRVNGPHGMEIDGLTGSGVTATLAFTDIRGKIAAVDAHSNDVSKLMEDDVKFHQAYITFSKAGGPVTEDDLKGIIIRTFNGCKVVNTKETAIIVIGNIRVEDNAAVYDSGIRGSGYFGGNSVTENAYIFGSAYVTDNGVFSPAPEAGKFDSAIHIEDNAKFLAASRAGNTVVYMCGDSEFSGTIAFNTISLAMYGKSRVTGKVSVRGILILEDNADTSGKTVEAYGCIRLVGNYRQTKARVWTGRRAISSENEPTYDNNVKTKYDFYRDIR